MTKAQIIELQDQIESILQRPIDIKSHTEVMQQLTYISTMLGTCSICVTESKRIELTTRAKYLRQHEERINSMKPSVAREFVNTACVEEQILSLRCEKNYSALSHAGENLRSVLSTMKTEMQLNAA